MTFSSILETLLLRAVSLIGFTVCGLPRVEPPEVDGPSPRHPRLAYV